MTTATMTSEVTEEQIAGSTRAPSRSSSHAETKVEKLERQETNVEATKKADVEAQQTAIAEAPRPEFPEGGWRGWATVMGACVSLLTSPMNKRLISPAYRFCVQFCGFG